jgi:hypothetical protein
VNDGSDAALMLAVAAGGAGAAAVSQPFAVLLFVVVTAVTAGFVLHRGRCRTRRTPPLLRPGNEAQ